MHDPNDPNRHWTQDQPPPQPAAEAPSQAETWVPPDSSFAAETTAETSAEATAEAAVETESDSHAEELAAMQTEEQINSGANWFYWVAGLSAVNTVMLLTEGEWSFIIGLGITQVIDGIALGMSQTMATKIGVVVFDLLIYGSIVAMGYFARRWLWLYVTGMVLFLFDSLIFLVVADWIGFGFHLLVLFFMWPAVKAFGARKRTKRTQAAAAATQPPI